MYGINDKVYEKLIRYFNGNQNIFKVILFGSRATGNYKFNSDIDLCIECEKSGRGTIVDKIDELVGIYSCDVVFFDKINKDLEKQIKRDGIKIYET